MNIRKLFRRKPKPTKRSEIIKIPKDMIVEVARLDDAVGAARLRKGGTREAIVALWTRLDPLSASWVATLPKGSTCTSTLDWTYNTEPRLLLEAVVPPQEPE